MSVAEMGELWRLPLPAHRSSAERRYSKASVYPEASKGSLRSLRGGKTTNKLVVLGDGQRGIKRMNARASKHHIN